jgi:hypothetical protein
MLAVSIFRNGSLHQQFLFLYKCTAARHAKAGSFLILYKLLKIIQLQRFLKRKRIPPAIKQTIKKDTLWCLFITVMSAQKNHVHLPA